MVKLGFPIALTQMLDLVYNLTDTFWLGRIGSIALAAISASWPVVWLVVSSAIGFLRAGLSLISQYWGANEKEKSLESAGNLLLLALILGVPLSFLGYIIVPGLMMFLGVPEEVLLQAIIYSRIVFLGLLFVFITEGVGAIYMAAGDTVTPLIIKFFGVSFNLVLDPLLILGLYGFPRWGVKGAAIATVASQGVASLIAFLFIKRGIRGFNLRLIYFKPKIWILSKLSRIGFPLSILSLGEAGGFTALLAIISMCGADALAAWGIGDRITNIIGILVAGLIGASSTIIGQALGASFYDRAKTASIKAIIYGVVTMMIGMLFLILIRYPLVNAFAPTSYNVINYASFFILIMGPSIIFLTIYYVAEAVGQGSGDTKPVMIIGLTRLWVLRNILAYLLGPGVFSLGVNGLWIGMALSNIITGIIALFWIFRGNWVKPIIK